MPDRKTKSAGARARAEKAGRQAESLCCLYLWIKGYRILARRYRGVGGEIDIIARKSGILIAIEVKQRASENAALFAVTARQQNRIAQSLQGFAAKTGHAGDLRMDVMTVRPRGRIRHHINVWMGP
ncbi:hypothetical protein TMES_01215 [Thalassospira mesophila]|uniref:UPF0102 protein TMES_01215 n=1 Tax=Thalassospira mesophila TaxID=1293891 RepID=A0A1Y2L526_9PROT|nr:hypothetical protein TMES_01215 [Thalassospira mesophila]